MKKTVLILVAILFAFTTNVFSQEDTKQEKQDERISEVSLVCDMACGNCANDVKKQLAFTKGVKFVEADYEKDVVVVKYRNDKTDSDKIIASLAEIDYKASVKKACCPSKSATSDCSQTEKKACGGCSGHKE